MDELPDEVLEFIFWRISPYVDFKNIKLVSRRWYHVVKHVIECRIQRFETAALRGSVAWRVERAVLSDEVNHSNPKASAVPVPGPAALPFAPATRYVYVSPSVPSRARYGHCAVFCADARSLYVFGGCSNESNAFNDLLRFDLLNSTWSRALVAGAVYPPARSYASLVHHENRLILFGGLCPAEGSLARFFGQQFTFNFFNDIHVYDMASRRWTKRTLLSAPPPAALRVFPAAPHALAAAGEASAAGAAGAGGGGELQQLPFLGSRHRSRSIGDGADLVSELLPPRLGFHAFCVVRLGPQRSPFLFIFGGRSDSENYNSDQLHILDLRQLEWISVNKSTSRIKPRGRFSHAVFSLDCAEHERAAPDVAHVLMVGGCDWQGKWLTDCWLLHCAPHPEGDANAQASGAGSSSCARATSACVPPLPAAAAAAVTPTAGDACFCLRERSRSFDKQYYASTPAPAFLGDHRLSAAIQQQAHPQPAATSTSASASSTAIAACTNSGGGCGAGPGIGSGSQHTSTSLEGPWIWMPLRVLNEQLAPRCAITHSSVLVRDHVVVVRVFKIERPANSKRSSQKQSEPSRCTCPCHSASQSVSGRANGYRVGPLNTALDSAMDTSDRTAEAERNLNARPLLTAPVSKEDFVSPVKHQKRDTAASAQRPVAAGQHTDCHQQSDASSTSTSTISAASSSSSSSSCAVAKASTFDALSSALMPPRASQQSRIGASGRSSNNSPKQCEKEQKRLATLDKYSGKYSSGSAAARASGSSASASNSNALSPQSAGGDLMNCESSSSIGLSSGFSSAMQTCDSNADHNADSRMDTSEAIGDTANGRRVAERGDLVALAASRSRSKLSAGGDSKSDSSSGLRCCASADGSQQCRSAVPPPPPEFDVYLHLLDVSRAVQDGVVSWRRLRVPYKYEVLVPSGARRPPQSSSVTYEALCGQFVSSSSSSSSTSRPAWSGMRRVELVDYSVCLGREELLVFGGREKVDPELHAILDADGSREPRSFASNALIRIAPLSLFIR